MRALAAIGILVCVLLGAPSASAATKLQQRYTVTAAYDGSYEEHWSRTHSVSPPSLEWNDWAEIASYVGRSTRPFTIRRSPDGRRFAFDAKLKVSASVVGGGLHGFYGDYAGDSTSDPQYCQQTRTMVSGPGAGMSGTVLMRRGDRKVSAGIEPPPDLVTYRVDELCSPSGFAWSNQQPFSWGNTTPGWEVSATQLRKRFGRAFTITSERNYTVAVDSTLAPNRNRLVLRFTPVGGQKDEEPGRERWQVEVAGADRWSWGMYTTLGAGVWVKWAHRTILEIEDDKLVSATGNVRILGVTPFSDVKDAFAVTNMRTTTPGEYAIPKRSLSGNRVHLGLLKVGSSEYRVEFTVRAGPRLLEALQALGVPDPQGRYDAMVARGGVPNTVVPLVPNDPQVQVELKRQSYPRKSSAFDQTVPCARFQGADPDCLLRRGAEIVDVQQLG